MINQPTLADLPPQSKMIDKQMEALERFIWASPDGSVAGKAAIIYLIRRSENLTKPVSLSIDVIPEGNDYCLADELSQAARCMLSRNGRTHLYLFFQGMGTKFTLSYSAGGCIDGKFDYRANMITIWICPSSVDHDDAENFKASDETIRTIITGDPGASLGA